MKRIRNIVIDQSLVDGIERYRRRQVGEIPSKTAAIRKLLQLGLQTDEAEASHEW
jgi:hypothetical protein